MKRMAFAFAAFAIAAGARAQADLDFSNPPEFYLSGLASVEACLDNQLSENERYFVCDNAFTYLTDEMIQYDGSAQYILPVRAEIAAALGDFSIALEDVNEALTYPQPDDIRANLEGFRREWMAEIDTANREDNLEPAPEVDVDLYVAVANRIAVPIEVQT